MAHSQLAKCTYLSANLTNHDRRYKHSHEINQWEMGFHFTQDLETFHQQSNLLKDYNFSEKYFEKFISKINFL